MFQCFTTKNIWPGIFTFSLTLFQFVAKRFETFQSSDLVIFGSVSICFSRLLYNLYVSMFLNKKYMAWNFHLFLNLVSICCETFRNVSNFGLSHFWVCFNLFQSNYYIIYMFQCFTTKNIWPGIFTFSLTLFQFVAKRFKTFQISDLVIFALFQFVSVDLLYNLYVSMFRNKKYMAWYFHLFSNLVSVCCETFRNVANFGLSHFWVCFNLFQLIHYIIYMFQLVSFCFETCPSENILTDLLPYIFFLFQCFNVSLKQMHALGFLRGFCAGSIHCILKTYF